jgi:hypothetical protein
VVPPYEIQNKQENNSSLAFYVFTNNMKSSHSLESIKHMETHNPIVTEFSPPWSAYDAKIN